MVMTATAGRFIARHDTGCDAAFLAERLEAEERLFDNACKHLAARPVNIASMYRRALDAAGWRAALAPDDPRLHRDLQRAVRCACAMAEMVSPGPGLVAVDVGLGAPIEVPRLKINDVFNPDHLRLALFAAIVCRDRASIETLCRVDVRGLTTPGSIVDDFAFTFVEFLQGLLTQAPWAGDKLVQALNETDPAVLKTGNVDYALYIAVGEIDTFYGLSSPDVTVFNEKLATALERHKRFYEAIEVNPGESQRNDPRGFIAMGPLAATALAHDHGRTITVKSDYLPAGLVTGRFAAAP
jgi:Immunity protein 49